MNQHPLKLCLVTDIHQSLDDYLVFVIKAIQGGVTSVQLRMKNATQKDMLSVGMALKAILTHYAIPLIINDNVHVAKALGAHLHIGPHDMAPKQAREMLGRDAIIGLSIESEEELETANALTCINYVAASAIFPSNTKPDCKKIWGLTGLTKLAAHSVHPVIAIGGIDKENAASVIQHGACGVAVVGAIHHAENPTLAATDLVIQIDQALKKRNEECLKK